MCAAFQIESDFPLQINTNPQNNRHCYKEKKNKIFLMRILFVLATDSLLN